jgi:DNA-directed RNA polymerase subunit N (RpoN/RPB10)
MIIPIRCFTCGHIVADKLEPFIKHVNEKKNKNTDIHDSNDLDIEYINVNKPVEKSIEGIVLDELNIHKYCCRRMLLSNVHLISII